MTTTLRLYAENLWMSPYVFSSHVALEEKGLAFDIMEISLMDGEQSSSEYASRSLTARVPCLEHDGFSLSESSAIAEYLEENFGPPTHQRLFPKSVRDRARARQSMAWLRSDLSALREERSTVTMFYRFELPPLSKRAERDAQKLIRVAEASIPEDSGCLFGEWSLVDSELAFMLHRLLLNGHALPERVRRYAEREWQRPSVRAFVEHARPEEVPDAYWTYAGISKPTPKKG
ncbi:MAG: glutathione transferase [Polyangiaceae bacterium]